MIVLKILIMNLKTRKVIQVCLITKSLLQILTMSVWRKKVLQKLIPATVKILEWCVIVKFPLLLNLSLKVFILLHLKDNLLSLC